MCIYKYVCIYIYIHIIHICKHTYTWSTIKGHKKMLIQSFQETTIPIFTHKKLWLRSTQKLRSFLGCFFLVVSFSNPHFSRFMCSNHVQTMFLQEQNHGPMDQSSEEPKSIGPTNRTRHNHGGANPGAGVMRTSSLIKQHKKNKKN